MTNEDALLLQKGDKVLLANDLIAKVLSVKEVRHKGEPYVGVKLRSGSSTMFDYPASLICGKIGDTA